MAVAESSTASQLVEVKKLGRPLNKRASDIVAYFDRSGTSNLNRPGFSSSLLGTEVGDYAQEVQPGFQ